MKSLECGQGDQRQLHVMMRRECLGVHNVNVGLSELAIPTLLWTLASPDLLNLVTPEGKSKLVSVLEYIDSSTVKSKRKPRSAGSSGSACSRWTV